MKNPSLMILLANAGFMLVLDSSQSPSLGKSANLSTDIDEISSTSLKNIKSPVKSHNRIFKEIKEEIKPMSCNDGGCMIIKDPFCSK